MKAGATFNIHNWTHIEIKTCRTVVVNEDGWKSENFYELTFLGFSVGNLNLWPTQNPRTGREVQEPSSRAGRQWAMASLLSSMQKTLFGGSQGENKVDNVPSPTLSLLLDTVCLPQVPV